MSIIRILSHLVPLELAVLDTADRHFVKWPPLPSGTKFAMAQYISVSYISVYMCAKCDSFITKCTIGLLCRPTIVIGRAELYFICFIEPIKDAVGMPHNYETGSYEETKNLMNLRLTTE